MTREIEIIVGLQSALDELADTEERLRGVPDWMRELHDEHSDAKRESEALEAIAQEALREQRATEGAIEESREKLERYRQQIGQVSTQREYGALLKEIDTMQARVSELEDVGSRAAERRAAAETEINDRQKSFDELDERYAVELRKWEEQKPQLAKTVQFLEGRITVIREQLRPGVLAGFERTEERHPGTALAAVRRAARAKIWHCDCCNYRVRPQVVVEISRDGKVVHCESCKRILYLDPPGT